MLFSQRQRILIVVLTVFAVNKCRHFTHFVDAFCLAPFASPLEQTKKGTNAAETTAMVPSVNN